MTNEQSQVIVFKNQQEAYNWLKSQGYPLSRASFYNHCKTSKLGPREAFPDPVTGKYTSESLQPYLKSKLLQKDGLTPEVMAELQKRKIKAETELAEQKLKRAAWEMEREQGKYLPAERVYLEFAARHQLFKDRILAALKEQAADILIGLGVDIQRRQTLVDAVYGLIEDTLDRISQQPWRVFFGASGRADEGAWQEEEEVEKQEEINADIETTQS